MQHASTLFAAHTLKESELVMKKVKQLNKEAKETAGLEALIEASSINIDVSSIVIRANGGKPVTVFLFVENGKDADTVSFTAERYKPSATVADTGKLIRRLRETPTENQEEYSRVATEFLLLGKHLKADFNLVRFKFTESSLAVNSVPFKTKAEYMKNLREALLGT